MFKVERLEAPILRFGFSSSHQTGELPAIKHGVYEELVNVPIAPLSQVCTSVTDTQQGKPFSNVDDLSSKSERAQSCTFHWKYNRAFHETILFNNIRGAFKKF